MTIADLWAIMPIIIVAAGAILVLIFGAFVPGRYTMLLGFAVSAVAALVAFQDPVFASSPMLGLAYTPLARFFTILFCAATALTFLLSHGYVTRRAMEGEEFPAVLLFALFGMCVLAAATNLLVFFLGLESLSFAFYILVASDRNNILSTEAGLKYLLLGGIAAAFMSFGIALIYVACGSLEIPMAIAALKANVSNGVALAGWGLLFVGIAFKAALVPFHLYTPDVYQGGPAPIVALGAKGAAVAAFLILIPAMGDAGRFLQPPLWVLACLSMIVGNLAALMQNNLKRMLAYSSIAQMGYVTLALLTGTQLSYTAVALYIVVYMVMNLAAFGVVSSLSHTDELVTLDDYRGLGFTRPVQGLVLAVAMFGLAGIPPTSGFIGKFTIIYAAIQGGQLPLTIIMIVTAIISVYYYLRVVAVLYMQPTASAVEPARGSFTENLATSLAAGLTLAIGLFPDPLIRFVETILH